MLPLASSKTAADKYATFNELAPIDKTLHTPDAQFDATNAQFALELYQGYSEGTDEDYPAAQATDLNDISISNITTYKSKLTQLIHSAVAYCNRLTPYDTTPNAITLQPAIILPSTALAPDGNDYRQTSVLPFRIFDGLQVSFVAKATNTGAVTVQIPDLVGSTNPSPIVLKDETALSGGEITVGHTYKIYWRLSSSKWILITEPQNATSAEVLAATEKNKFISPATLASAFANSQSANGYTKLPNGIIIQWGISSIIVSGSSVTITLPIAFPNSFLSPYATVNGGGGNITTPYYVLGEISNSSQIILRNTSPNDLTARWLAIGY